MNKVLYYAPQMRQLATQIVELSAGNIRLGDQRLEAYDDGWPDYFLKDKAEILGADAIFLASFDQPADVFRQLSVAYALPRFEARSTKVIVPDFTTGQTERLDADENGEEEGKIATAMTMARMLSAIPFSECGPARIIIYDIHALQEKFYFSDSVIPRLRSTMPILQGYLCDIGGDTEIAVVFPDEGADKRFAKMFQAWHRIFCSKKRDGEKRDIRIESGHPRGKHAIIVDDRVQSGGTLLVCKDRLFEAGAAKVSVFVPHAIFTKESWRKCLDAGFERFWITDSHPEMAATLNGQGPFRTASLDATILKDILR